LKNTLALVLAGGRRSRLMNLTEIVAKPAVPFAGKFRIIDFPLSNCINSGIRRVAVLTQYRAHTLIEHVQRGWGFLRAELRELIEVWPAQQQTEDESWYRGTAAAGSG
jgi:glucose-1-phosphate adenylyltransferase